LFGTPKERKMKPRTLRLQALARKYRELYGELFNDMGDQNNRFMWDHDSRGVPAMVCYYTNYGDTIEKFVELLNENKAIINEQIVLIDSTKLRRDCSAKKNRANVRQIITIEQIVEKFPGNQSSFIFVFPKHIENIQQFIDTETDIADHENFELLMFWFGFADSDEMRGIWNVKT
jgi:hypothetical protein